MKKPIILLGILIAIFVGIYLLNPVQIYKQITLKTFYSKLTSAIKTNDCATIYSLRSDNFKSSTSQNKYISECQGSSQPFSTSYTVYSYNVQDNIGYVDRLYVACKTSDCTGQNRHEDRLKKKYLFINGNWTIPDDEQNSVLCSRTVRYSNPEEFNRAISLIIQRSNKGGSTDFVNQLNQVRNCLDIKYANSSQDMANAEGYFDFSKDSSNEDLKIFVSPKYESTDDLLTAILLDHEITHAMFYANGSVNSLSCYENEAYAYTNEFYFFSSLNAEEKQSIYSREYKTADATETLSQFLEIIHTSGTDYYNKALNYVKNNPYYQKQCQNGK